MTRPLEYTLKKPKAAYVGDCINIPNPTERTAEQIKLHRETVKRCLMKYGAVGMAFNTSSDYAVTAAYQTAQGAGTLGNCYYDGEGEKSTNHLVTIVGWDDNYPRENFRSDKRPSANGAFRVKNSRGENYNDQGGYFWLSYEDYYAGWYAWCVEKVTPADTYDSVYYHDPFGADYYITGSDKMYGANVFERRGGDAGQTVTAVGVSVLTPNTAVSVYVNNGKNQFTPSTLTTRSFELPGYYTILLDAPVNITQPEFTVGAIYSAPSGTKLGLPFEKSTQASLSVCNAGESFYSTDGVSYTDTKERFGNLSIRALTTESRIEMNSEKLSLRVGETAVLKATVIPQALGNKITWSSSNEAVVSVNDGVLTAKAAGAATITASTESGASCTCLVTVRQPSELVLSASSVQVGEKCEFTCELLGDASSKQIDFYIFREGRLLLSRAVDSSGKTAYVPNKYGEYLAVAVCRTSDGETLTANLRLNVK